MICPDIFECYDKSKEVKNFDLLIKDFNKEMFDNYLVHYVETRDPVRIDKMKKYIEYGFSIDAKISKYNVCWLEFAILHNDIPLTGILVKNNANIHLIDSNNLNLIFKCILSKNEILLKYFLNLGVNPNLLNRDNDVPLTIACIMQNGINCAKILLEHPNIDIELATKQDISLLDIIINKIEYGEKKYTELLDIVLKKKKKLNLLDLKLLRTHVCYNHLEIVKIFVNNFPNILNKSSDDEDMDTIVHMALHEENNEMLEYFFTFKELDYTKTNKEDINYLEYLCGYQMFDMLDLFCKKYPKSLDITYLNSQSIIENVILTHDYDTLNDDELESIKKIIRILISNGANINYKNNSGYTPIFPSIQYSNADFVKFMIGMGANIREPIVRNNEFPPVSNNDPVSFAIQLNKFEIFKTLIECGGILHHIDINGNKYYTSVLICLKYKRQLHFEYLLKIPEIKIWIQSNNLISNYLFDYGIKNGCLDELILREIVPEFKIKSLDFTDPNCIISHNEKKISICIEEYKNITNKTVILNGILETITILLKLSSINHKNYSIFFKNFENLYENISESINMYDEIKNIHNNIYEWVDCFIQIICDKIDYYNMHIVKKIFEYVFKLYWEVPDDTDDENSFGFGICNGCGCGSGSGSGSESFSNENLNSSTSTSTSTKSNSSKSISCSCAKVFDLDFKSNEFVPKIYTKKINTLYKLFESKKSLLEEFEKEILLIIKKYDNNDCVDVVIHNNKKNSKLVIVIKKLFKLFWPIKQPHYEYMYNNIVNNNDKILDKTNLIVMTENKIKSTIFNNPKLNIPPRWIKTYAPNIGKEEKNDPNHTFSFLLDNLLEKFPCVFVEAKDPNHNGTNILCYFNGLLEVNGDIDTGCYEYFINSNGTLFHRMFRPWKNLSNNIKKLIKN